jgi:hypothetical protein
VYISIIWSIISIASESKSGSLYFGMMLSKKTKTSLYFLTAFSQRKRKKRIYGHCFAMNAMSLLCPFEYQLYINDVLPCQLVLLPSPTNQRTVDCVSRIPSFSSFSAFLRHHIFLRLGRYSYLATLITRKIRDLVIRI